MLVINLYTPTPSVHLPSYVLFEDGSTMTLQSGPARPAAEGNIMIELNDERIKSPRRGSPESRNVDPLIEQKVFNPSQRSQSISHQ